MSFYSHHLKQTFYKIVGFYNTAKIFIIDCQFMRTTSSKTMKTAKILVIDVIIITIMILIMLICFLY